MSPSVAVVILNWNGRKHLETYLPSVVKHSGDAIIYLADNASTDDSVAYTKENFPSVKFIINETNGGFAKGYNDALKDLTEDYFVLLNSDVEVTANWIPPVIEVLETKENVRIAQPKIKAYLHKEEFEYAGAAGGFIDYLGYPFCQGRIFDSIEKDNGQYNISREVFWATGACMFIKASLFKNLNGFDECYFAHMEEIDLCWRAKNMGYSVFYVAESTVYHLGGGTMNNTNPRKTFLNFRNSLMTLYKNDQSNFRLFKLFLRMVLDGVAFFKLLISSGPKHAFAILQAHFSFYKMEKIRSSAENPNLAGISTSSIVWMHYFRGVRKYSQLK